MLQFRIIFISLVYILAQHEVVSFLDMIGNIQTLTNFANDAKDFGNGELPLKNLLMGSTGYALSTITNQVDAVAKSLSELRETTQIMNTKIENFMNSLPLENRIDAQMSELHSYIVRIDGLYKRYEKLIVRQHDFSNYTIKNFIDASLADKEGDLPEVLHKLSNLMQPERSSAYREPLPDLVYRKYKNLKYEERCDNVKSEQQRLYELYSTVVITEARAYAMTLFAFAFYTTLYKIPMDIELEDAADALISRSYQYVVSTQRAMKYSSREIIRCQPLDHIRDKTFAELEGSITLFVVPEVDVNYNDCSQTCRDISAYEVRQSFSCYERWCSPRTCYGRVNECWEESGTAHLCELSKDNFKRYGFIEFSNGRQYGDRKNCEGGLVKAASWQRYFSNCAVCVCTCSEQNAQSTATRTINLRPQMSDIKNNKVIIGVELIHKDKQIMIKIKEAKLASGANIERGTGKWIKPEDFDSDEFVRTAEWYRTDGDSREKMTVNEDYALIRYYQKKIFLDDVIGPEDHVVTGVRFNHEYRDTANTWFESPIQLDVHFTKFDFVNGTLYQDDDSSFWLRQQDMRKTIPAYREERKQVYLSSPNDPTKEGAHNDISGPNRWIEFTHSDGQKDVGQSTVPFFDTQPVEPMVVIPLSGVGLVHRGADGSGGFLALRVFTVDLRPYLNSAMDIGIDDEIS